MRESQALSDVDQLAFFRSLGTSDTEAAELLAYVSGGFSVEAEVPVEFPMPDDLSVRAWENYAREASRLGVIDALRNRLVQLRFPVAAGISDTEAYRAATRRGIMPPSSPDHALELEAPDRVQLIIHLTAAGRIPIIIAGARADFVTLLRALCHRNEPVCIPDSLGACIVGGYNNWDRVAQLRRDWEREQHEPPSDAAWNRRFREIAPNKELYQDRFIVLSSGPYSATPAASLGLAPNEWRAMSLVIRREHECAHYFTRRLLGSMRNSLLDELIADYVGIVAACGRYRARWFQIFMGAEPGGAFRPGGRLENYRGQPPLSDGAFAILHRLVLRASSSLERFDVERGTTRDMRDDAITMYAIARTGLSRLAYDDGWRVVAAERNALLDRTVEAVHT